MYFIAITFAVIISSCLVYRIIFYIAKSKLHEENYIFEPSETNKTFEIFLNKYFDIAKLIIGLSSGSVTLIISALLAHSGEPLPLIYAPPLLLFLSSIIFEIMFVVCLLIDYEAFLHATKLYSKNNYAKNIALGFSGVVLLVISYFCTIIVLIGFSHQ